MGGEMIEDSLKAAPIDNGCCIRVEGRATMRQSHAALDIARRTFDQCPQGHVVLDLTGCTYLDSTFIGCLLMLYRSYGRTQPPRFHLAAPLSHRTALLGLTKLDQVIPAVDAPPPTTAAWVEVDLGSSNPRELAEHIMDCHRRLAETDGPMAGTFARIAEQMERELGARL